MSSFFKASVVAMSIAFSSSLFNFSHPMISDNLGSPGLITMLAQINNNYQAQFAGLVVLKFKPHYDRILNRIVVKLRPQGYFLEPGVTIKLDSISVRLPNLKPDAFNF